jgi:hypothetical protein
MEGLDSGDSVAITQGQREIGVYGFMVDTDCDETEPEVSLEGRRLTLTLKHDAYESGREACIAFELEYEVKIYDLERGSYLFTVVYDTPGSGGNLQLMYAEVLHFIQ